jgi:lantibiotic biosynthesis protein
MGGSKQLPFLPRVSYGRFILSHARWILTKDEIKGCDNKNDEELLSAFWEIKKIKNLPDYVRLTQGDNELLLHLQNIFCIRLLLAEVNKAGSVILTEVTDTPDQCWLESPDGNHSAEFIVAFSRKKTETATSSVTTVRVREPKDIKRIFPVGSEWLYAKIYCGTNTAEKLLSNILKPFTEELFSKHLIDKFFFLRYMDEGHHIRIRFHNHVQKDFWGEVISCLQKTLQPYLNNGTVNNLQFEIYRREIERYGIDTMELSEDLFWQHSVAVMNFISMLDGDEGEQYRWQVGLKAIDLFLDDFGYTLDQKCKLIKDLDKTYSEEFKIGYPERKKISERFADHKQLINVIMSNGYQENENQPQAISVFTNRSMPYQRTVERILRAPSVAGNMVQLNTLMQSYIHMFINRLFVSNQRKTELVIYEYLLKYYSSELAKQPKGKQVQPA